MPTVLVTGATGFLGPYVLAALVGAGFATRAAVRTASNRDLGESVTIGDLGGAADWRGALRGVDTVVHLAGRAHRAQAVQEAERTRYFDINTAATLQLARSAAEGGVKRFLFMSTIFVNGAYTDGRGPFRADDPPAPNTVYAESKAEAEAGLAAIARETGLAVTVVRPPLIYGRNARGNFATLGRAVRAGIPLPLGAVRNRRAFVAAENVASFVTHSLRRAQDNAIDTFIVADDEQVSTAEFIRRMGQAMARPARLVPIAPALVRASMRIVGLGNMTDSLLASLEVDTSKTTAADWRPPISMDQGLALALGAAAREQDPHDGSEH